MAESVSLRFHQRGFLTRCHLDGDQLDKVGQCPTCIWHIRRENSNQRRLRDDFFRHLGETDGNDQPYVAYKDDQHGIATRRPERKKR